MTNAKTDAGLALDVLLDEVDPGGTLAPCGLRRLILGQDVLTSVADVVAGLLSDGRPQGAAPSSGRPRVALLVDPVRIERAGADVKELVEDRLHRHFDVRRTVLDDGHPTLHVVDAVLTQAAAATAGVDAVVAVGGGTISDIAKLSSRPTDGRQPVLLTVQTAASVDGYTNDMSVVLRDGVKRTVGSRWPDAVIADATTIAGAPARLTRAGYGEMTSMLVATADWRLAALVGTDDTYDEGAIRLLEQVGASVGEWSAGVGQADPDAVAALTRALALRGVAGGVARTTAPLSGVEHLVSHMLDLHHGAHGLPTGLHGAQVGVASVVAAAAWEMLVERLDASGTPAPDPSVLEPDPARRRVEAAFGHLDRLDHHQGTGGIVEECWRDYWAKLADLAPLFPRIGALLADWRSVRGELTRLARGSTDIAAGLRAAGAAADPADLDPVVSPELARWAITHCGLMRRRFTLVDLLALLGWWTDRDVDEVLDRTAAALAAAATPRRESRVPGGTVPGVR